MTLESIIDSLPLPQGVKTRAITYLKDEPVKFNARTVEGLIAIAAFVAVVFLGYEQAPVIAAAAAVIGLLEKQAASSRNRVRPTSKDEAIPVGGPGGDATIPPVPLPEELDVAEGDQG